MFLIDPGLTFSFQKKKKYTLYPNCSIIISEYTNSPSDQEKSFHVVLLSKFFEILFFHKDVTIFLLKNRCHTFCIQCSKLNIQRSKFEEKETKVRMF